MRYRFEAFELLAQERRLLAGDTPIAIGARAFDVLLTLVAHHDRVVTKHELLERVWPGLMVEENNLQVQVSSLRRVLGARAIATIPGRGYRLAMPTAACLAAQEQRWSAVAMLLGYGQAASRVSGVDAEEPAELRARAHALQALAEQATAAQVAAWRVAGAALATEAAYALVLEPADG